MSFLTFVYRSNPSASSPGRIEPISNLLIRLTRTKGIVLTSSPRRPSFLGLFPVTFLSHWIELEIRWIIFVLLSVFQRKQDKSRFESHRLVKIPSKRRYLNFLAARNFVLERFLADTITKLQPRWVSKLSSVSWLEENESSGCNLIATRKFQFSSHEKFYSQAFLARYGHQHLSYQTCPLSRYQSRDSV